MPRSTRSVKKDSPNTIANDLPTSASPQSGPKKSPNEYVEIRFPKVRFQDSPLSPLWVILLIVFAFLLGMTTTKIQYLQQGGTTTQTGQAGAVNPGAQTITVDTVKQWAKDIRLDSNKFNSCIDESTYDDRINKDVTDAIAASAEATPTFYVNGTRIVGAVPYDEFKTTLDGLLAGNEPAGEKFTVEVGGLPKLGRDNAPITMVEFSDLQCPFCLRFFKDTFPQLKKDYIDTGKVQFYFRHLPLTQLHPMAMSFANAAECANDQGKFWEMHDKIYNEQG